MCNCYDMGNCYDICMSNCYNDIICNYYCFLGL